MAITDSNGITRDVDVCSGDDAQSAFNRNAELISNLLDSKRVSGFVTSLPLSPNPYEVYYNTIEGKFYVWKDSMWNEITLPVGFTFLNVDDGVQYIMTDTGPQDASLSTSEKSCLYLVDESKTSRFRLCVDDTTKELKLEKETAFDSGIWQEITSFDI